MVNKCITLEPCEVDVFTLNATLRLGFHAVVGTAIVSVPLVSCLQEGRCGGGIAWQDSFKHIHVSLDTRLPVSYGPEKRYPTPSAMCEIMGQWFLMDELR